MPPPLPTPEEETPHPTEPLLEASLVQSKQIGDETNSLLQAIVHQNDANNPEHLLSALIVQSKQNADRIIEATKPAGEASSKLAQFLDDMKGEKGDDGHTPTVQELTALITPLIPEPIKGDDGVPPTNEELIALIQPLIPDPLKGEPGEKATVDYEKVVREVVSLIPTPKNGKPGDKGDPGKNGAPDTMTSKIIAELKKQIKTLSSSMNHSNMVTYRADGVLIANGAVLNIKTGAGVTLVPVQTKDGMDITISATGGSGVTVETPPETPNAVTTVFTVSAKPKWVVTDAGTYYEGFGYSYSALHVTMDIPPSQYIRVII